MLIFDVRSHLVRFPNFPSPFVILISAMLGPFRALRRRNFHTKLKFYGSRNKFNRSGAKIKRNAPWLGGQGRCCEIAEEGMWQYGVCVITA